MHALDLWLLHWLNAWVARSPAAFYSALAQGDRTPWVLAACTFVLLWFSGVPDPPAADGAPTDAKGRLTRWEARRRTVLTFGAMLAGFLLSRALQLPFERLRPLAVQPSPIRVPIDPTVWAQVQQNLGKQGSIPSDHAVMFFSLTAGVFAIKRWLGPIVLAGALYFSALRVGVGFHWPSDILAGAVLGVALTLGAFALARRWRFAPDAVVAAFEHYPVAAYPLSFLVLLDLTQRFAAVFAFLASLGSGYVHR